MNEEIIGVGAYTLLEGARLTGISARRLRGWVKGYSGGKHRNRQKPLWTPYFRDFDETILSFRDLVEARFIKAFADAGVPIRGLRNLISVAQDVIDDERPFSTNNFKTDGKTIFLETIDQNGSSLVDLKKRQHVFQKIVERTLVDIDFGEGVAKRWWAAGRKKSVLVDPSVAFGQPVIRGTRIPTSRVVEVAKAEGGVGEAATLFNISVSDAKDAIAFEAKLTAKA
ncbi:MAG: DUF433 domain-containing protein [Pseudomonadota bacterium]